MANSGKSTTNTLWPLVTMSTSSGLKCYKKLEYCPKGHQMDKCQTVDGDSGRLCKQCDSLSFQPNRNKFEDYCRLRKSCRKPFMMYENKGTTVTDATCKCELGYHFENEDHRACVPNRECIKGFGQGMYEDSRLTGKQRICADSALCVEGWDRGSDFILGKP